MAPIQIELPTGIKLRQDKPLFLECIVKVTLQDKIQPIECTLNGCFENVDRTKNTSFGRGLLRNFEGASSGFIAKGKDETLCWEILYFIKRLCIEALSSTPLKENIIVGDDPRIF